MLDWLFKLALFADLQLKVPFIFVLPIPPYTLSLQLRQYGYYDDDV